MAKANDPKGGRPAACEVGPDDLKRLGALHDLLRALNDPFASKNKIETLSGAIPVLSQRIIFKARSKSPLLGIDSLGKALNAVGNRGLETVLLELLEDLTTLKSELEG
jgi:hypothetical protein